jgi:hypothetical protein
MTRLPYPRASVTQQTCWKPSAGDAANAKTLPAVSTPTI